MLEGRIVSASPISPDELARITATFAEKLGQDVTLVPEIDAALLGGFLVEIHGSVWDSSIRGQLDIAKRGLDGSGAQSTLFNAQEMSGQIKRQLEGIHPEVIRKTVGRVTEVGDGVLRASGLDTVRYGEMVLINDDIMGLAMSLDKQSVGIVLFGETQSVVEGSLVTATGKILSVPVGDALLGRVVNPLGEPLDDRGRIAAQDMRPIEHRAPGILERQPIHVPLQTGLMTIDSMVPIGRGQRQLIIGDRQTGKTAIAVDTILAQKDTGVICIYVAIGQKASTVAGVVETLQSGGAMPYTIVVMAGAGDPAPLQYIAPYAGCAMGEAFMEHGRDVLIVYDDLSKHAVAYRAMALLLRRPPGREAYPGDVFYLHSRLLERAACLSEEHGGGSMTALPIVETMAGDISSYIPTNVISITDGQIFLESELFFAGVRPAVNLGLSVSRVGGAAQTAGMRRVSGSLRLSMAQYRELKIFTQFGSELDVATQEQLQRGERLTEALKQEQFRPMSITEQVLLLAALTRGMLDDVPMYLLSRLRREFYPYLSMHEPGLIERVRKSHDINMTTMALLGEAVRAYLGTLEGYTPNGTDPADGDTQEAEA